MWGVWKIVEFRMIFSRKYPRVLLRRKIGNGTLCLSCQSTMSNENKLIMCCLSVTWTNRISKERSKHQTTTSWLKIFTTIKNTHHFHLFILASWFPMWTFLSKTSNYITTEHRLWVKIFKVCRKTKVSYQKWLRLEWIVHWVNCQKIMLSSIRLWMACGQCMIRQRKSRMRKRVT